MKLAVVVLEEIRRLQAGYGFVQGRARALAQRGLSAEGPVGADQRIYESGLPGGTHA